MTRKRRAVRHVGHCPASARVGTPGPGPLSLLPHVPERSSPSRVRSAESFQIQKRFSSAAHTSRALEGSGPFCEFTEIRESGQLQSGRTGLPLVGPELPQKGTFLLRRNEGHF